MKRRDPAGAFRQSRFGARYSRGPSIAQSTPGAPGRLALALFTAILIASASASADPQPPRVASLAWARSPGAQSCVGPRALSEAVERKLGREAIAGPPRANLAIEGRIERDGPTGPWRATLAIVSETGEVLGLRELRSDKQDCRTLDDELALVVALLIDPGAVLGPIPPTPFLVPPPPVLPPPIHVAVLASPQPPMPAPPRVPWRVDAEAGVQGGLGLLPGPAVGITVRMRATPPRWPAFELGGSFWLPRPAGTAKVGASFSLTWASLMVCPLGVEAESNGARLCVGGVAGALRAESFGLEVPFDQERLDLDLGAELGYSRRLLGPLVASLGFVLLVPAIRNRFYYVNAQGQRQDLFQQAPVAGALEVTLGVAAP